VFDPVKRLPGCDIFPISAVSISKYGRSSFSDGDVNTAKPGAIHTNERLEIPLASTTAISSNILIPRFASRGVDHFSATSSVI